jgi:peptidoglycan/LPS O-acetylase OafA/YrhL
MTLGQQFDSRNNALNVWRLILATGVILDHSFAMTGKLGLGCVPVLQLRSQVWVDGFFAISGFLITSSWVSNPRLRDYFVARGLRIFPGLWVCVAVIAFVFAPVSVAIQGGSAANLLLSRAPIEYFLNNSVLNILHASVGGTPNGVPWPHVWNGSIWTLIPELFCYLAVAGFGVAGLLNRRWLIPALFVLTLLGSILLTPWGGFQEIWTPAGVATRFGLMFLAGALLYQFQHVVPARWSLVAVSTVIVLASSLLPNYRLLAAIPLAYAIIVSGALLHHKRLRLRTDLSYGVYIYAWPVQELLAVCGLIYLSPPVFAIIAAVAVVPLAALSWFLVEKPALSLKRRLKRKHATPATPAGELQPG